MMKLFKLYLMIFVTYNLVVTALFQIGLMSKTIFFYRGIALIMLSAVLIAAIFMALHLRLGKWKSESIVAATAISACLQLAFFVTVPVTLDRSISVFLLDRINSHDHGLTKEELTDEFISEYVHNRDAIGRRIYEQTASRNIQVSNGIIKISGRGQSFLRVAALIKKIYGIKTIDK